MNIASSNRDTAGDVGGYAYLFPLSMAQERLWFLDQLMPQNSAYNVPMMLPIKVQLNVGILMQVLNEIIRRHEVLRTRFVEVDGKPCQAVLPLLELNIATIDLTNELEPFRQAEAQRLALLEIERPFDLAKGPLLRATLLNLGPADHIFVLSMHHIICDGWSIGILLRELSALYEAFCLGQPSPLPELPIQYADFAFWQRERLRGELIEQQIAFWKDRLAGIPPLLELPTDRPRPAAQSFRGAWFPFTLPRELTQNLVALGRQEGTTLFMTLLAAFAVLLHRYARSDDIVIGSPIDSRSRRELEGLIGIFTNTIVLRVNFVGDPTFRELLRRVREITLDAYTNQELPFEKLVEEIQPERNLAYNPIFQVMFGMQSAPPSHSNRNAPQSRTGQRVESEPPAQTAAGDSPSPAAAKFDLTLSIIEDSGSLNGSFEYNIDLFDHGTAQRMVRQLRQLLVNAVLRPDSQVSDLSLLDAAERQGALVEGHRRVAEALDRPLLHQLVEAQAARTPHAIALVSAQGNLTYSELQAKADFLACRLRLEGVKPEVLVGICMERSPEMIVALLAVLKAGGAYVPIDASYPPARLKHIITTARPVVVLADTQSSETLSFDGAQVLTLAREGLTSLPRVQDKRADGAEETSSDPVVPKNPCYVMFTSGSTGWPKGVVVTHRSVANHMIWMRSAWPLTAHHTVLQKTPIAFDASVWEIFLPLMCGARLFIAAGEDHRDPATLVRTVIAHGITDLQLVPTMLEGLLAEPELDRCVSLQRVFLGGEVLPRQLVERFARRSAAQVINLYGPTEATIQALTATAMEGGNRGSVTIPIGFPIDNAQAIVLDDQLRPVAPGIPGELYLGGACLARGYLSDPRQTAERFIPNLFGKAFGERLYRTGDIVRRRSSGQFEFIGRNDQQIKIRGYRIELSEIEGAIREHPDAVEAVASIHHHQRDDARIVAYVVTRKMGDSPIERELYDALKARLPPYMVPSSIVRIERLPRLPNGKLDRRSLPAPTNLVVATGDAYVAPRNAVEAALADIWADVLVARRVSVEDDFFELGGHSLLATQVFSRIRDTLQVDLPLRVFFENPTVASLAVELEAKAEDAEMLQHIAELILDISQLSGEAIEQMLRERSDSDS